MFPDDIKYTETHQWARIDGSTAEVGITDYAQEQLGEVVYLNLPEVGDELTAGEVMGSVESVKSISDLYSPVSGKVVEINEAVLDDPAQINAEPYGAGWMVKIEMANASEVDALLSAVDYQAKLG